MPLSESFAAHLASGATTVCRCWALVRTDGQVFGFTDHDRTLSFEGIEFRADTGLTARALQQTTGLSVDNSEALGALSDASLTEEDILAGRYDNAEVRAWLVNWAEVGDRVLQFRGTVGEVARAGGAFEAELRGLTEALNQPQGRVYQKQCAAILGDAGCRFDLTTPGYATERSVEVVEDRRIFRFASVAGFDDRWFERGRFRVLSGRAEGLVGVVKNDRATGGGRQIELWEAIALPIAPGDMVRIEAGCDKRADTCRLKFQNFLNFRGFPDIPGEDWLMSYPVRSAANTGGSRNVRA
ncbi:MAG: DUF2163 domain-containing protein [Rhodobacteraceae bacterium]|jgi:uncharacterized phage protein (TIGR02218 family)|nr:DUF2163 domain-containing protein [Paracoccaceae bacterium]